MRSSPPTGWRLWLLGARARTLPAAVVPVLVGTAAAAGVVHADGTVPEGALRGIVVWRALAAAVVALAIQVGTNFANDYSDGVRGTDDPGERVGPPRLVGNGLKPPGAVKRAALVSFGVAAVAGLALAAATTWWLLAVGAVCFAAGWFYTGGRHPYGYYGFGELFVFVFFGLVATVGSTFVQVGAVTGLSVLVAVPVGCLATALLVVNNLRDIPSDRRAGKRTLAVRIGDQSTRWLYLALLVVPFVLVPLIAGAAGRLLAVTALLAVLPAQKPLLAVLRGDRGPQLVGVLVATGRVQLIYGLLLSAGLFLSAPTP